MITQITNVDEFILLQPQLLIDIKNYLLDYLNDQTSDIFQSNYKTLVIDYLNSSDSLIDKSAICKKYLSTLMHSVIYFYNELKLIDEDKFSNFFIKENNELKILENVLKIQNNTEKINLANKMFEDFFSLLFHINIYTQEKIINIISSFLQNNKILNVNNNHELMQSFFTVLLRIINIRRITFINEEIVIELNNLITTEGVQNSFLIIPPFNTH